MSEHVTYFLRLAFFFAQIPNVQSTAIPTGCEDCWSERAPLRLDYAGAWTVQRWTLDCWKWTSKVSQVPYWSSFISWAAQQQKLIERRKIQRVNFVSMRHNFKHWLFLSFYIGPISLIPYHQQSIVWATGKYILMEFVPSDILNWRIMIQNLSHRCIFWILLLIFFNVPNANSFVCLSWKQDWMIDWIPGKAITIGWMTDKFSYWFLHGHEVYLAISWWNSVQARISMTISCSVHLPIVLDSLHYFDLVAFFLHKAFTCIEKLTTFSLIWHIDPNLGQTAFICLGWIQCQQSIMRGGIFSNFNIRQPFKGVRWDIQWMKKEKIINMRSLLLPYLVLVVYDHLLFLVEFFIIDIIYLQTFSLL